MTTTEVLQDSQRVLLLTPTPRDATITQNILHDQQIETFICSDMSQLCQEASKGVGLALVAEEHLLNRRGEPLALWLNNQPLWSDLPLIVLTLPGEKSSQLLDEWHCMSNVTLIGRPVRIQSFLSLVRSRLSDRRRQYTVRNLLNSLDESGRQIRLLADAMPQMVFAANAKGGIDYFNARALDFLGSKVSSFPFRWSSAVHSDDADRTDSRWQAAIAGGKPFQIEFRLREAATGNYYWHLGRALPVKTENGEIVRWFGTCTDIQQQKDIQKQLNEALEAASHANVVKNEFIANMSHEIRTPMTAVLGYAELLARKENDAEKLEFLKIINRNGNFLLEIINDILDLSKIEAGKLIISEEPVPIQDLINEVESIMQVRAADKQIDLQVTIAETIPKRMLSDAKRLRQILFNLVGNAIKFTEKGSVRLSIYRKGANICFEVQDTGIGMTKEQIRQLFQSFQQGDASVNRRFGGTGLGLAISQRLAGLLGGEISVSSEYQKGSTFCCTLPLIEAKARRKTKPENAQPLSKTNIGSPALSCRILIVDDRRDIRFLAGKILEHSGAEVQYAENGLEAIELVTKSFEMCSLPDIVLMDMQMPFMDGYEATARLRELGFNNPIIALTAEVMQGEIERCIVSGCNAYLSKPIDSNELLQSVVNFTHA